MSKTSERSLTGKLRHPAAMRSGCSYRYHSPVTIKSFGLAWSFLLCGGLCFVGVSCSTSVRRCIRTGDAEFCGNRTGAGAVLQAKGLKPGSTVKLSSAVTGPTEATVGADGQLAGTVGLIFPAATDTVVSITASTAAGDLLTGELSFPKP
jgi:hypothetical protein